MEYGIWDMEFLGILYFFIKTNVGLLIFDLMPNALAKPLTKVVFPAPNSPSSAITLALRSFLDLHSFSDDEGGEVELLIILRAKFPAIFCVSFSLLEWWVIVK